MGVESIYLIGVVDNYFVAIAKAADFDLGDGAGGGRENRGFAGGADVNAGVETVKSLGVAVGFGQRQAESGFGQDVDGIRGKNGGFGRL